MPDNVRAKDLFAVRYGFLNTFPAGFKVDPGDILIVWAKPGRLHPGMIVLERNGATPSCRQINMDSDPDSKVLGQVIALLRQLK